MTTTLKTDLTIADIVNGFTYNELEGKGLFGWGGKLVTPEIWYNTRRFRRSVSPLGASGSGFGIFLPPPNFKMGVIFS